MASVPLRGMAIRRGAIGLLLASLALGRPALGQPAVAPQWFGTWRIDLSRSAYPGEPAFRKMTCRIEPWNDGIRVVYDIIGTRGGVTHLEWTGALDGRDRPLQGVEDVVTNAYRAVDDRTFEVVQKVDGVVSLTATMRLSPDGRTMTTVTAGSTAVFTR